MAKEILYKYNPETDNFERYYPSVGSRIVTWMKTVGLSLLIGFVLFFLIFYCFDSPTEENLRSENRELRTQYKILNRRIENSLKVMERLQERDDNFYRVMMQMEPLSQIQRLAGLEQSSRYQEIDNMSDAALVSSLNRRMDLMERQILAQVQSYDQLRETIGKEKEKMSHIPGVLPIKGDDFTLACGFGHRKDPVFGHSKYHEGIDITSPLGTPVYATGDGKVAAAERRAGQGNFIEINHGYNYQTRYAHLAEMTVKEGDEIKRGQLIGRVGSTGVSSGPHLHYEVCFHGEAQNPVNYFFVELGPDTYSDMLQRGENAGHLMD